MALTFFFSEIFSNILRVFFVHQNDLCKTFLSARFFFIEIQKIKESSVQNETMKTLNKLLY